MEDIKLPQADNPIEFWQSHLKSFEESDLTGIEYCRSEGLKYSRFHYWKKKLSQSHPPTLGGLHFVQAPFSLPMTSQYNAPSEPTSASKPHLIRLWIGENFLEMSGDFPPEFLCQVIDSFRRV